MSNNYYLFFIVAIFIAVFLTIEGFYIWWNKTYSQEKKRFSRRVQSIKNGALYIENDTNIALNAKTSKSIANNSVSLLLNAGGLELLIEQAGIDLTVKGLVVYVVSFFIAGVFFFLLLDFDFLVCLFLGGCLALLPVLYLQRKKHLRLVQFDALLPDTLDLIRRSLQAGHALPRSLQMVAEEMVDPVGEEFQRVHDELNFGVSVYDALDNLTQRVPSTDLKFFVTAVLIQRETGGSLSTVLNNISNVIRERVKLLGKVRAISAEGRLSGLILTLLPFVAGVFLYAVNPDLMSLLWTDSSGVAVLKFGLMAVVVGVFWIKKIVNIKV